MKSYADAMIGRMLKPGEMNFSYTYLPLVLGGILVQDRVLLPDEKLKDILNELKDLLDHRAEEHTEDTDLIFELQTGLLPNRLENTDHWTAETDETRQ